MESQNAKPSVLIIAAMGRSGTSWVSSLLKSAGLDIGQRLLGPGSGNIKGHFEDQEFLAFHISALESQGLPPTGFTLQRDIHMDEQHCRRARQMLNDRSKRNRPWGWKEPRTVLFLDFWQSLIPEANFLILYRSPWEVADSLFRRGDEAFHSNPAFAVRVWLHYNRLLLDFHDRHPGQCLCVNSYRAAQSPALLLEALFRKFALRLGPVANLFEESLFHHHRSGQWASLLKHHFPEAMEMYEALNERARNTPFSDGALAAETASVVPDEDWLLKDWLDLRYVEGQCDVLRGQWEQSRDEAIRLRETLNRSEEETIRLREALKQAEGDLDGLRDKMGRLRGRFRDAQQKIANMESSKFWKLRKTWLRIKEKLPRAA